MTSSELNHNQSDDHKTQNGMDCASVCVCGALGDCVDGGGES